MSLHPSLVSSGKTKKQRTVLKRIERIKYLMEKELWHEGDSVFGLPKIKIVRIKFKKEKAKEEAPVTEEAVPSEGTEDVSAASTKSTSEKPATGSKDKPR